MAPDRCAASGPAHGQSWRTVRQLLADDGEQGQQQQGKRAQGNAAAGARGDRRTELYAEPRRAELGGRRAVARRAAVRQSVGLLSQRIPDGRAGRGDGRTITIEKLRFIECADGRFSTDRKSTRLNSSH